MSQGEAVLGSSDHDPGYRRGNEAKAEFDDAYNAPTPHAYLREMSANNYCISEQTRPFFTAAAELLREKNGPAYVVQMLDVGCSYGIGAATVKFGCTFDEIASFFAGRAPTEYLPCVESTRLWLNATAPQLEVRVVGLDSSSNALRFAHDATMIQGAIETDFEDAAAAPSELEREWLRGCNLLVSSGAIGYVTSRTFEKILPELGRDQPAGFGPLGAFSILRMFDEQPIRDVFEKHGWSFGRIPGVHLPQRRFADAGERDGILDALESRGVDAEGLESEGLLYADLFVVAPEKADFRELRERMIAVAERHPATRPLDPVRGS